MVHERPAAQPVEQLVPLWRLEDVCEGVRSFSFSLALTGREEMKVVVAEHADHIAAMDFGKPEHFERVRSAVDQIANQPKPVTGRLPAD